MKNYHFISPVNRMWRRNQKHRFYWTKHVPHLLWMHEWRPLALNTPLWSYFTAACVYCQRQYIISYRPWGGENLANTDHTIQHHWSTVSLTRLFTPVFLFFLLLVLYFFCTRSVFLLAGYWYENIFIFISMDTSLQKALKSVFKRIYFKSNPVQTSGYSSPH